MSLCICQIMKWQTGKHQNWKRVRNATTGTSYLLNTYRMDSIWAKGATKSSLYYFDNPFNNRDSGCYMEVVKTPAELIAYMDTAQHTHITFSVYPKNDATETPANVTIGTVHLAYAVAVETNDGTTSAHSWVTYTDSGLGIHTVLVNHTLAALFALV